MNHQASSTPHPALWCIFNCFQFILSLSGSTLPCTYILASGLALILSYYFCFFSKVQGISSFSGNVALDLFICLVYSPFCFLFACFVFFLLHHTACRILAPQPGFESGPSAMRVQSPNHWTTRNAFWFFVVFFFFLSIFYYLFFLFFLPFFFFPLLQTLLSRADFQ